jgi:branched-chain amino acid transport system substrate-binding protein
VAVPALSLERLRRVGCPRNLWRSNARLRLGRREDEVRVKTALTATALAIAVFGFGACSAFAQSEQFIPRLVYRTGPYAPNGIPFADGYADYLDMIDARDGGIGGVKITYEECETGYNNDKGVECYERLKNKGPTGASLVDPLSTGITYALIERATADKIPVVSMGYGRADASDGGCSPMSLLCPPPIGRRPTR